MDLNNNITMSHPIKDYDQLRKELRVVPFDVDYSPREAEPTIYQATLFVTDDQMQVLNKLVADELKRVQRELSKAQSAKQKRKLEDLEHDVKAIQETMKENVW